MLDNLSEGNQKWPLKIFGDTAFFAKSFEVDFKGFFAFVGTKVWFYNPLQMLHTCEVFCYQIKEGSKIKECK